MATPSGRSDSIRANFMLNPAGDEIVLDVSGDNIILVETGSIRGRQVSEGGLEIAQKIGEKVIAQLKSKPSDEYLRACATFLIIHAKDIKDANMQSIIKNLKELIAKSISGIESTTKEGETKVLAREGEVKERARGRPQAGMVLDMGTIGLEATIPTFDINKLKGIFPSSNEDVLIKELENISASITDLPFELERLKSNTNYADLKNFNLELMRLHAMEKHIQNEKKKLFAGRGSTNPQKSALLNKYAQVITDAYKEANVERIKFVKSAFSENPVYALAIPVRLTAGPAYYTASTKADIQKMAREGIPITTAGGDATCCASKERWEDAHKPGIGFKGYELGDKGIYFGRDQASYLNNVPGVNWDYALRTTLIHNIDGVSIPYLVAELAEKDLIPGNDTANRKIMDDNELRFPISQVEKGFRQIQEDFNFAQKQGLADSDTEVVFYNPRGALRIEGFIQANSAHQDDFIRAGAIKELLSEPEVDE